MITQELLDRSGYIVIDRNLESITYKDYLREYGADETTTPNGVAPRYFVQENEFDGEIRWEIRYWGPGGNRSNYSGTFFDNEEDAILALYEGFEWYISEKNWDAPAWHDDREGAVSDLANMLDRKYEVVDRYLAISTITDRKEADRRKKEAAIREAQKSFESQDAPREAATIRIDDEFKSAIVFAEKFNGLEKSNRIVGAVKALLARNGKEKIEGDFWKVARILKARVDAAKDPSGGA